MKFWKKNIGNKIIIAISVLVIMTIITAGYGYIKEGVKNDINKEDIENIEYLKKENKVFEKQFEKQSEQNKRIEDHLINNSSAWKSVIDEIQKINSKLGIYDYRIEHLENK